MEDLGTELMATYTRKLHADEEKIRDWRGATDAAFVDGKFMATQYQAEIGQDIFAAGDKESHPPYWHPDGNM